MGLALQDERFQRGQYSRLGVMLVASGVLTQTQVTDVLEEQGIVIYCCPTCALQYNVCRPERSRRYCCPVDGRTLVAPESAVLKSIDVAAMVHGLMGASTNSQAARTPPRDPSQTRRIATPRATPLPSAPGRRVPRRSRPSGSSLATAVTPAPPPGLAPATPKVPPLPSKDQLLAHTRIIGAPAKDTPEEPPVGPSWDDVLANTPFADSTVVPRDSATLPVEESAETSFTPPGVTTDTAMLAPYRRPRPPETDEAPIVDAVPAVPAAVPLAVVRTSTRPDSSRAPSITAAVSEPSETVEDADDFRLPGTDTTAGFRVPDAGTAAAVVDAARDHEQDDRESWDNVDDGEDDSRPPDASSDVVDDVGETRATGVAVGALGLVADALQSALEDTFASDDAAIDANSAVVDDEPTISPAILANLNEDVGTTETVVLTGSLAATQPQPRVSREELETASAAAGHDRASAVALGLLEPISFNALDLPSAPHIPTSLDAAIPSPVPIVATTAATDADGAPAVDSRVEEHLSALLAAKVLQAAGTTVPMGAWLAALRDALERARTADDLDNARAASADALELLDERFGRY